MTISRQSRLLLVLEVGVDIHEPCSWVRLSIAVPGRVSHTARVWDLTGGSLSPSQLEDVVATTAAQVSDALLTRVGVQEVLPGMADR